MACGKPAIASYNSGHLDVLTNENSLPIRAQSPLTMNDDQGPCARWQEPSLDETIEKLEWAYNHRDELQRIGDRAGTDLSRFTWRRAAEQFYALLTRQDTPPPK
jgi:glycosyltransferase involved in cell wall biosynthesis